jgi:hypothetical protein
LELSSVSGELAAVAKPLFIHRRGPVRHGWKTKKLTTTFSVVDAIPFTYGPGGCWQLCSKNTANLACQRAAPTGHGKINQAFVGC